MGAAEIVALLIQILKLGGLILGEYFEAKKRQRLRDEQVELEKIAFSDLAARALERMREDNRKSKVSDQSFQDRLDDELKK